VLVVMSTDVDRGSTVLEMSANDIDLDSSLSYSIVSGNHDNAFVINRRTGLLSVDNRLDFERVQSYRLNVQVIVISFLT